MLFTDYTGTARKFAMNFPKLSYVLIQINFWILANNLMGLAIHYHSEMLAVTYGIPLHSDLAPIAVLATVLGVFHGMMPGMIFYQLDKGRFRNNTFGVILLFKASISIVLGLIVFITVLFISEKLQIPELLPMQMNSFMKGHIWKYTLFIFMIYYFIMSLLLGFINFNNKKYGPGVLLPLLMGKYRKPVVEHRIFMFMDLQSSTQIAEQIGHLKYSSFIRDCFQDIDQEIINHHAEIYQYAGDEIIVSWNLRNGFRNQEWLNFFFACQVRFVRLAGIYQNKYGVTPKFKAGVHAGPVTAVEVGDTKREIAFHGDTINTAARIQALCNTYKQSLLISKVMFTHLPSDHSFRRANLGSVELKGKQQPIAISSIERNDGHRQKQDVSISSTVAVTFTAK